MGHRIKKSALKWAWAELNRLGFDPASEDAGSLATAAAVRALRRWSPRLEWRQPLPAHTGLEFDGERVMLAFLPEQRLEVRHPPTEETARQAGELFTGPRAEWEKPLEIVALKALEPNFEWLEEPPFDQSKPTPGETAS